MKDPVSVLWDSDEFKLVCCSCMEKYADKHVIHDGDFDEKTGQYINYETESDDILICICCRKPQCKDCIYRGFKSNEPMCWACCPQGDL